MLTRSDCWEPLERRPFIHLRHSREPGQAPTRGIDRDPVLRPEAVDRVIRRIGGLPGR